LRHGSSHPAPPRPAREKFGKKSLITDLGSKIFSLDAPTPAKIFD